MKSRSISVSDSFLIYLNKILRILVDGVLNLILNYIFSGDVNLILVINGYIWIGLSLNVYVINIWLAML